MTLRNLQYGVAGIISIAALILYIVTLCPTVDFIDAGELAAVCATLGISHPTGYPLFTLIGRAAAQIVPFVRTIYLYNLLAAVECAVALFVFFQFLMLFKAGSRGRLTAPEKGASPSDGGTRMGAAGNLLPAIGGTIALAGSATYWSRALSIEVYALHILFLSLLLFLFTKLMVIEQEQANDMRKRTAYWYCFAYMLGLAFTNHLTTILLAPGLLYWYFATKGSGRESWIHLVRMMPFFLLGLSLYIYLPLRSGTEPIMNWGNPATLERWVWHIIGKQYHTWAFNFGERTLRQSEHFFGTLLPQFGYLPFLLVLPGIRHLWRHSRRRLSVTLLLFFGCVLYSVNYDVPDIDSYFILAFITVAIWIASGIEAILGMAWAKRNVQLAMGIIVAVCLAPAVYNYADTSQRNNVWVEEYAENMFRSLEQNAVLLTPQWDYFVSPAFYLQHVERKRPDVVVIDKELLRRPWYCDQLARAYPGSVEIPMGERDAFAEQIAKVERNEPVNAYQVESRYAALIKAFIDRNIRSHPVYVTHEIDAHFTRGYRRVPSGLAYRLFADTLYHHIPMPELSYHAPTIDNWYTQRMKVSYIQMYANAAIYSDFHGNKDQARAALKKALEIDPASEELQAVARRILGR